MHDFVIMPDHLHLLITVPRDATIERAMQLIKGRFSFRVRKEHGFRGEVWQRGFSEVRVNDLESFLSFCKYIQQNPVKAGLADSAEPYPYSYTYLAQKKLAGARQAAENSAAGRKATPQGLKPSLAHPVRHD